MDVPAIHSSGLDILPLGSTNPSSSVTGAGGLGTGILGSILCACAKSPFPPSETFHSFLQVFNGNLSTPSTPKCKSITFISSWMKLTLSLGMPSIKGPQWNCFAELLFGTICKLILKNNWRNNLGNSSLVIKGSCFNLMDTFFLSLASQNLGSAALDFGKYI